MLVQMGHTKPSPSFFINHINVHHVIAVTLFSFFLKASMRQMSLLYAMSFFIMEGVDLGKKTLKLENALSPFHQNFEKVNTKQF